MRKLFNLTSKSFSSHRQFSTITGTLPIQIPNLQPKVHPSFKVRSMTLDEFKKVTSWANDHTWYFSEDDPEVYYKSDPRGFFVGEVNGEPVCSYVCFDYGDYFFRTLHIVKEDWRDVGYGKAIEAQVKHYFKNAKILVFDAMDQGIVRYTRLGFKTFCQITTYRKEAEGSFGANLVDLRNLPQKEIFEYELNIFKYSRSKLWQQILAKKSYQALGVVKEGKLKGVGVLRKCQDNIGYGLGPIIADDQDSAEQLFEGLQSLVVGETIYAEIYECNPHIQKIIHDKGWTPLFWCKRMYGGEMPKTDITKVYSDFWF